MDGPRWQGKSPCLFQIVTGFFPETSPKETWVTNPRPLMVCGVAQHPSNGMYFCRVAYGTSNTKHARDEDLVIANMSLLDQLGLKKPTRFVLHSGKQMVVLPWIEEFFRPWTGYTSPVLSILPAEMQRHVGFSLAQLSDLPMF